MKARALTIAALATVAAGCVDLNRTNPLDPAAPLTIVVTASRETLTAVGQSVKFSATLEPSFPDAHIKWGYGTNPDASHGDGPEFEVGWGSDPVAAQAFSSEHVTVTAWVGPHIAVRRVALSQRFGGIRFTKCFSICVAFTDPSSPLKAIFYARVDSLGTPVLRGPDAKQLATDIESRDRGTIELVTQAAYPANEWYVMVRGIERGATWLVYTHDAQKDSIRVFADLKPASIQVSCPGSISVGSKVQLSATILASGGAALIAPYEVVWSNSFPARATVNGTGLVTGVSVGTVNINAVEPITGISRTCVVDVTL
jgi:hypothetical protein